MVWPGCRGNLELGAKKSGADLGHQLLEGIGLRAKAAGKVAIEALGAAGPVRELMKFDTVVGFGGRASVCPVKAAHFGHLDVVVFLVVVGPVAAVSDIGQGVGDKHPDMLDDPGGVFRRGRLGFLPAVLLIGIEDGPGLGNRVGFCDGFAGLRVFVVGFLLHDFPEDDRGGLLSLADLAADGPPLLVASPPAGGIAFIDGRRPEKRDVDAMIRFVSGNIARVHDSSTGAVPGHFECFSTGFDGGDDLAGHVLVDITGEAGFSPRCFFQGATMSFLILKRMQEYRQENRRKKTM